MEIGYGDWVWAAGMRFVAAIANLARYTGYCVLSLVPVGPGVAALFSLFGLNRFRGLGERNHPIRKGRKSMPTSSKPDTGAIHRVLIDSGADPKLVHPAIEEIGHLSGQNVITAVGAQIADLRSEMQAQINDLRCEMQAQINDLRCEMQAQINGLQVQITGLRAEMNTLNKVIWPLISLLFIPMLGLLYKILTQ